MNRTLTALPIVALALLGLTACGGSAAPEQSTEHEAPTTSAPTTESSAPAAGEPIRVGDIEFVVRSAACTTEALVEEGAEPLAPEGKFCVVALSVTALADIDPVEGMVTLATASGEETGPDLDAMIHVGLVDDEALENGTVAIAKGESFEAAFIFDIAADTDPTAVVLRDTPTAAGVSVPITAETVSANTPDSPFHPKLGTINHLRIQDQRNT